MELVQHGDTVHVPGPGITAAVALSPQNWIVGTADGTLLSLLLDSRGSKRGVGAPHAATKITTHQLAGSARLAGAVLEIMVIALDEGSILLAMAKDEPYLILASTSLLTTYRTVSRDEMLAAPTPSTPHDENQNDNPPWMVRLQWHTQRPAALALRADDQSNSQVLVVLLATGYLKLFESDHPETPVELLLASQLFLSHLATEPSSALTKPSISIGGLHNNVICILNATSATFVRIGRGRQLAVAATLDLSQRLTSPRAPPFLADPLPATRRLDSAPVPQERAAAAAVVRFLQGVSDGILMKGELYKEKPCVELPNDEWLLEIGGAVVAVSSFGAVTPPDIDDKVPAHEQPNMRLFPWHELLPSELILQVVSVRSLVLARKTSKPDEVEVFSRRRRKSKDALQVLPGWRVFQSKDCRMIPVRNKFEGDLICFAISERGGLVTSLELRRPLQNVVRQLVAEGDLDTALLLLPDSETREMQQLRLKIAERELKAGFHNAALKQVGLACDASSRAAVALNLRERCASSTWKRKENAQAWATFLLRNRQTLDLKEGNPADSDTEEAILEALCVADSSAERVLSFLSSPNVVTSGRSELIITSKESSLSLREQNSALLQLYKTDSNHHRVLQLLETSPDGGVEQVRDYMDLMLASADDELDDEVASTFFNHLGYIVEEAGSDVAFRFLTCGSLPFDQSVAFLRHRRDKKFFLRFLEYVHKDIFCVCDARTSTVLLMIIEELTDGIKSCSASGENAEYRQQLRQRLNRYLRCIDTDGDDGDSELVLSMIPDSLYEERAFVLRLLHREEEAIDLLLFEGGCLDAAEHLCSNLPGNELNGALESIISSTLTRITAGTADDRRVSTTAAFLSRFKQFDIQKSVSFSELPGDLPISKLRILLTSLLSASNERMQEAKIQSALLKADSMRLHQELLVEKKRYCLLDKTSMCQECQRPIGDAAFALNSGGELSHYSCFRKVSKAGMK